MAKWGEIINKESKKSETDICINIWERECEWCARPLTSHFDPPRLFFTSSSCAKVLLSPSLITCFLHELHSLPLTSYSHPTHFLLTPHSLLTHTHFLLTPHLLPTYTPLASNPRPTRSHQQSCPTFFFFELHSSVPQMKESEGRLLGKRE